VPAASTKDDREKISEGDRSLLIIEDDENFARILAEHAKRRGYKCIIALTGQEGLLCAENCRPSAITLDMFLPDITGDKVLEQLKSSLGTRHIPVHIVSSSERSFFALQKGAIGHLKKPPSADDLNNIFMTFDRINAQGPKRVLVVEDDDLSRLAIQKCIESENLIISSCKNGKDAFQLLQKNTYDCVILDLNLPGMNGFEILERISKTEIADMAPIIIYTGKDLSKEEQAELFKYTSSVVIKGVKSSDRLIDELHLFLHSIESTLPLEQQNIVRMFHEPGQLLRGRKVLLVDDDMRNTYALSAALRKKGLTVLMADNGEMALLKLAANADVDIVIMDIMMPVMDGYEAMRLIRKQAKYAALPIIALTAKVMPEDKARALQCGANDFLTKPVDVQQLTSLMQILLFKATEISPLAECHV
jgi:CheY-like chemotaxis protein